MSRQHLTATEGMLLTNGEVYVTNVWLGNGDTPDNWWKITREEADKMREGTEEA